MTASRSIRRFVALACSSGCLLLAALASAAPSLGAVAPYWDLSSSAVPANLKPGSSGKIVVNASNLGDAPTSGEITLSDKLPAGITLKPGGLHGELANQVGEALECDEATLTCSDKTFPRQPSTGLKLTLEVNIAEPAGTETTLQNEATVTGGGAPTVSVKEPVRISETEAVFGVEKYALKPVEEGGAPDARAGSHPFQLNTTLALNQNAKEEPLALPKNLQFKLPPGLLGNPNAVPQCSQVDFNTILTTPHGSQNLCKANTAIGVAEVTIDEPVAFQLGPETRTVPVFNVEPAPGEPARFGFVALKVPVVLTTAVRTGTDYGVTVTASNTSEAGGVVSSRVSFWGEPADQRHDIARGWQCVEQGVAFAPCKAQVEAEEKAGGEPKPFLSLPTSCGTPLNSPMQAQSWVPGASYLPPVESEFVESLGECSALQFNPTITTTPDTQSASTPLGLAVDVLLPQEEKSGGLAEATVKSTTVTLPEGVQLNPAAAGGLLACSSMQIGFTGASEKTQTSNSEFTASEASCPKEAKVGTVEIESPDLKAPLTGYVYLASQDTNPFEAPLVLYLVAEEPTSKVLVKLAGSVTPNPVTGQLVSTFANTPQVPFSKLHLSFFGGPRASLASPALCGTYTTGASMTPWSGQAPATPSATLAVTSGPGGGACSPSPLPFAPSFAAGSESLQAGGFTPFALTIGHPDGNQALGALKVSLPAGMAAMLSSVTPCPEPQAARDECSAASLIGHSTASSGLGGEPFSLPGQVFLTGPYKGAPFGLSVVTPAIAGPFNLGDVTVRSTINVDPSTAAVTIVSDPFPTIIKGVPVQLKQINVHVDRPGFQFNPTNCNASAITGTLSGAEGATEAFSTHFQVAGCAALPFKPVLTATTESKFSKSEGASLVVKVLSSPGQANIAKTRLVIPQSLPSRLTTIQKACPEKVFAANPATCPEGSNIGHAVVHTPVLKGPLVGPAYLVSHGGAAFPDAEFVLQGEGITLILDGNTNIHNGVTTSTFNAVPDAPVSSFEAILPRGPHSVLTAFLPKATSLCGSGLTIATTITGQNGFVIQQNTKVAVSGCKAAARHKPTRAQLLAKALKKCHRLKAKGKRASCERSARRKYGPVHAKRKHKKH